MKRLRLKKIIHLSDLHIGYRDMGKRFGSIADDIVYLKQPAENYVIVITGDIVEKASDSHYRSALRYCTTLRTAGFSVLVVPGNHDYGSGAIALRKNVRVFKGIFFDSIEVTYPKLDFIGGIAFIGLDSMAEELHWYDALFAQGEQGSAQLQRLNEMLGDARVKRCAWRVVYLHHHPFDPRPLHELKDSNELGEIVRAHGNIDALLYGHNHEGRIHNGVWGVPRCYDAGSATHKDDGGDYHRVINLERDARWDYDADFRMTS